MIKVYILIIVILLFSFCYKKRTVENFYHYEKKPKHRKYFDIILKNQKKLKSSKNAELIIKKAYQDKDFKNENRNSVIYGNIDIIKFDKKDTLWKSLTNKYGIKKASKLIPESRIIYDNDYINFIDSNKNSFFIIKKNVEDGKGLFVSKDKNILVNQIKESLKTKKPFVVIQKIVMNPLLIDKKTFKIRMFLTITSKDKKISFYLSKHGYIGYSKNIWDAVNVNFENVMASPHWNDDILKKSKCYQRDLKKIEEEYKNKPIFIEDFKKYLESRCIDYNKIFNEIKRKSYLIMKSIKMSNKYNNFIVTGIDVIFDNNYNPYILEFNRAPGTAYYNFSKKSREIELQQKVNIYNDSLALMFPKKFKNNRSIIIL
jgi:hypothetical protein